MSSNLKAKGEALYQKMKRSRDQLVSKYKAGGTIRYDVAIGLRAPSTFLNGVETLGAQRTKTVPHFKEDGTILAGTRTVIDFDAVKTANQADGVASGTMIDALKKRAEGKTVILNANDSALAWGQIVLGEVECMLQLGGNIKNANLSTAPAFIADTTDSVGMVHALQVGGGKYTPTGAALTANPALAALANMKIESEMLTHRGLFVPQNYRGDADWMKNPVSIWAITDKSRQSQNLFGHNSVIRMWGENQVIDLNGFSLAQHERPARVAAFNALIDLSDGHFAGLSQKGARNAFIYSSNGVGMLLRNNHFSIRGHYVKGCLIEGIQVGAPETLSEGSYFGTAIFNDSSEIVMKDVHQKFINKAVPNSSAGLSWFAQMTNIEALDAKFETTTTFSAANYPWLKWDNRTDGLTPFGHNKQTPYPVLKTSAEITSAITGVPSADRAALADKIVSAYDSMKQAYYKSQKNFHDAYIQGNTTHGDNFRPLGTFNGVQASLSADQIPRVTNLVASNPKNEEGVRYPDSVAYGFRAGSASEGVGKLAGERGGTIQDIYVMDCSFSTMHLSPMEAISLGVPDKGLTKTFNGMALRPLGYSNSLSDAASMASSTMLISKQVVESVAPGSVLETEKPLNSFSTADLAVANSFGSGFTAAQASGLYKGNDISEASLAAIEFVGLLRKAFTAAGPSAVISGSDNSSVDLGILAWRKSMLSALSAKTACHIGLKGGYNGDIFDAEQEGEIYPFFVSTDGSVSIDKDTELLQAGVKLNRALSAGYLGCALPSKSDSIFKLKLVSSDTLALVTADSETPVTYQMCADILGFSVTSQGTPESMSAPVIYKLIRNLDGQNHVHKGAIGVRVDEASRVLVSNVKVSDIETADAKKPVQGLGSIQSQVDFGVNYSFRPESTALEIQGVSLNGVTEGRIENFVLSGSHSGGSAYGVRIAGKSSDISIENVECSDVQAGESGTLAQPFGEQKVVAVKIAEGTTKISVSKVKSEGLIADHEGLTKTLEIESDDCQVAK
jgi:hypothetical protein